MELEKNDAKLVENAKTKISHLYFGRNHPIYQNIVYLDILDTISIPEELKISKNSLCQVREWGILANRKEGMLYWSK